MLSFKISIKHSSEDIWRGFNKAKSMRDETFFSDCGFYSAIKISDKKRENVGWLIND